MRTKIMRPDALKDARLTLKVLNPVHQLIRFMDGKKGVTLSSVYPLLLQIDEIYSQPILGLDEPLREKMHDIFTGKWNYAHEDFMTASAMVHPEHIKRDWCASNLAEFKSTIKKIATPEHTYVKIVSQYQKALTAIRSGANDFTDEMAFSSDATSCPGFEWCATWLCDYPDLQWAAIRLVSIRTGSAACEHSFGVEAWIHSKKRNRLGQLNVERLLRAHTNLVIEEALSGAGGVDFLPWDIELVIEEPEEEEAEEEMMDE
jgi:hypothetical protein